MPKKAGKFAWGGRGGRRPPNPDDKRADFFGHDDRTSRDAPMPAPASKNRFQNKSRLPRVSFKNQLVTNQTRDRRRDVNDARRAMMKRILDDDIPMGAGSNNNIRDVIVTSGRGRGTRGRHSPLHKDLVWSPIDPKRLSLGETSWRNGSKHSHGYRVTIPYGQKYEKEFLVNTLLSLMAPETFTPILYKKNDHGAVFYVDEAKTAQKLQSCDKKMTMSDGYKLQIRVEPGFPQYNLDATMKEKMKLAMAKRFVQENNALDLSRFHHDPDLVDEYYCALTRPAILLAALDIVSTVIPNLNALNLDHNQITTFDRLHLLTKKLSSLKILYVGDNKLKELGQLNAIKELKLEELRLAGNPLCLKYSNRHDEYVSDVRKRFPNLQRLDGEELPAKIGFDLENEQMSLPPSQKLFTPNENAQKIAGEFLQEYFRIFDSGNRQPLLAAYHEQASFSLTVALTYNSNKFSNYISDSRNLCKVLEAAKRRKLLKQGRLPVVSYISELPKTRHDLNSFTMDISLVTEGMMMITVSGLFKELETRDEPLRYFSRTFIIVPEGSGYCISNEMLHITKPTERQEDRAFKPVPQPEVNPAQAPGTPIAGVAPGVQSPPGVATTSAVVASPISDDVRTQMTLALSERTNMNLQYSLQCLEDVKWDFNVALAAFQELHNRGQIPPDAFKK